MAEKSKFQKLMDAALTGSKPAVDKVLAENEFSVWELLSLPGQFNALPTETKQELAGVYRDHPDVLPEAARPAVEQALSGIEPKAREVAADYREAPASAPVPALRPSTAVASGGVPPSEGVVVSAAIRDRTSTEGMTPRALELLDAARVAGAAAGLARIDIVAAKGGGHISHGAGTEWDLIGYNADGSKWTPAQRVAVAEGARQAGADRFGLYNMERGVGKGTLHLGYSGGPGRPAAVWGANGLVRGAASRKFSNPFEIAFLQGPKAVGSMLAYLPVPNTAPFSAVMSGAAVSGAPSSAPNPNMRPADLRAISQLVLGQKELVGKGSSGQNVKEVQKFLNQMGVTDSKGRPLKEDGKFGILTRQALKAYQNTHPELRQDGILGPRTMTAILADAAEMQRPAGGDMGTGTNILASLAVSAPLTTGIIDQISNASAANAAGLDARQFSQQAFVASNIGRNMAGYFNDPTGFTRSAGDALAGYGGVSDPFTFHPGELRVAQGSGPAPNSIYGTYGPEGFNTAAAEFFNEFTPHLPNASGDPAASLGDVYNGRTAEGLYNATTAFARSLRESAVQRTSSDGLVSGGSASEDQFIPASYYSPGEAAGTTTTPTDTTGGGTVTGDQGGGGTVVSGGEDDAGQPSQDFPQEGGGGTVVSGGDVTAGGDGTVTGDQGGGGTTVSDPAPDTSSPAQSGGGGTEVPSMSSEDAAAVAGDAGLNFEEGIDYGW